MTTKIAIRDLHKTFATRQQAFVALDRVSIDIAAGEFFTIVGPSGCGKTTLLRIVAGLETPADGACARRVFDHGDVPVARAIELQTSLPTD